MAAYLARSRGQSETAQASPSFRDSSNATTNLSGVGFINSSAISGQSTSMGIAYSAPTGVFEQLPSVAAMYSSNPYQEPLPHNFAAHSRISSSSSHYNWTTEVSPLLQSHTVAQGNVDAMLSPMNLMQADSMCNVASSRLHSAFSQFHQPQGLHKSLSLSLSDQQMHYNGIQLDGPGMRSDSRFPQKWTESVHDEASFGASFSSKMCDHPMHIGAALTQGGGSLGGGLLACSKYLKTAQELLKEVANVAVDVQTSASKARQSWTTAHPQPTLPRVTSTKDISVAQRSEANVIERDAQGRAYLYRGLSSCIAERDSSSEADQPKLQDQQELQLKKVKLMVMLDEVDQRYKLYHSQMQGIKSLFESEAGLGSAASYTSLACQTISGHFRCLRDAIADQIRAVCKQLGESSIHLQLGAMKSHFVEKQIGQPALLMPQHAWQPQRGLPERSVSILRAWLFNNFLHPYPKDSDKLMLAKQTGLSRNQVSNWFINARVRLWKPMVEEMYQEETKQPRISAYHNSKDDAEIARPCQDIDAYKMSRHARAEGEDSQKNIPQETSSDWNVRNSEIPLKTANASLHQMGSSALGVLADTVLYSEMDDLKIQDGDSFEDNPHAYPALHALESHGLSSLEAGLMRYGVGSCIAVEESNCVSLTLGLQQCGAIEAPHHTQQCHYLCHLQQPSFGYGSGTLPSSIVSHHRSLLGDEGGTSEIQEMLHTPGINARLENVSQLNISHK